MGNLEALIQTQKRKLLLFFLNVYSRVNKVFLTCKRENKIPKVFQILRELSTLDTVIDAGSVLFL